LWGKVAKKTITRRKKEGGMAEAAKRGFEKEKKINKDPTMHSLKKFRMRAIKGVGSFSGEGC